VKDTKAYGFVPRDLNFAWEKQVDPDGIEREYACFDVILWTDRYEEARLIPGKAHSMELNRKTISGEWKIMDGKSYFVYSFARLVGLCVLGDNVEPCFEGSSFYKLDEDTEDSTNYLESMRQQIIETYSLNTIENQNQGGKNMPDITVDFKLSHSEIDSALWKQLNPNFTEQGGYVVNYGLGKVYDEYALAFSYEDEKMYRCYYSKAEDNVEITKKEVAFIVDLNQEEYTILEAIKAANEVSNFQELQTLMAKKDQDLVDAKTAASDFEGQIATLNTDHAAVVAQKDGEIADLQAKLETYTKAEEEALKLKKEALVESYTKDLDEEELKPVQEKLADFSYEDLEKELSSMYGRKMKEGAPGSFTRIPTDADQGNDGSVVSILKKYVK
jgi:hypothetical protein